MTTKEIAYKYVVYISEILCKDKCAIESFFDANVQESNILSKTFKKCYKFKLSPRTMSGVKLHFVANNEYQFTQSTMLKLNTLIYKSLCSFLI